MFSRVVLTVFILNLGLQSLAYGRTDQELDIRLSMHLTLVEEEARKSRYVGGAVLLGLGVGFGVAAIVASGSNDSDVSGTGAVTLGVSGGIVGLIGVGTLLFPTEQETMPAKFRQIPNTTPEQLNARVAFGEQAFRRLSDRARNQRYYGGAILAAFGVADIGWYATDTSRDYLLYTGLLFVGLGVSRFFIEENVESEYRAYQEWKRGEIPIASLDLNLAAIPRGMMLQARVKF